MISSFLKTLQFKTFLRNTGNYFSSALLSKILNLATFVILGNLLEPKYFAEYAIFIASVSFVSIFTTFGLRSGIMRVHWEDKQEILSNSLAFLIFSCILTYILIFLIQDLIFGVIHESYIFLKSVINLVVIKAISTSIVGIISTYYVNLEKSKDFLKLNFFVSILNFLPILSLFLLEVENDPNTILVYIFSVQVFSGILAASYAINYTRSDISLNKVNLKKIYELFKLIWVFFAKQNIGFFQSNVGLIALSFLSSMEVLGIYSFYNQLLTQMGILNAAFFKAYTPKIKNLINSNNRNNAKRAIALVFRSLKLYLIISLLMAGGGYLLMSIVSSNKDFFAIFVNRQYILNIDLLYFMLLLFFFGAFRQFLDVWQYLNINKIPKYIISIQFASLALLYIGAIYLVPIYNIYGILINQLIVSLFILGANSFFFHRLIYKLHN